MEIFCCCWIWKGVFWAPSFVVAFCLCKQKQELKSCLLHWRKESSLEFGVTTWVMFSEAKNLLAQHEAALFEFWQKIYPTPWTKCNCDKNSVNITWRKSMKPQADKGNIYSSRPAKMAQQSNLRMELFFITTPMPFCQAWVHSSLLGELYIWLDFCSFAIPNTISRTVLWHNVHCLPCATAKEVCPTKTRAWRELLPWMEQITESKQKLLSDPFVSDVFSHTNSPKQSSIKPPTKQDVTGRWKPSHQNNSILTQFHFCCWKVHLQIHCCCDARVMRNFRFNTTRQMVFSWWTSPRNWTRSDRLGTLPWWSHSGTPIKSTLESHDTMATLDTSFFPVFCFSRSCKVCNFKQPPGEKRERTRQWRTSLRCTCPSRRTTAASKNDRDPYGRTSRTTWIRTSWTETSASRPVRTGWPILLPRQEHLAGEGCPRHWIPPSSPLRKLQVNLLVCLQ